MLLRLVDQLERDWKLLAPGQVEVLGQIIPFDRDDGLRRLRRGDQCYTMTIDGRLAHYTWVQYSGVHPIVDAGAVVPVADGEFWVYNSLTAPRFRGKGLHPLTLARIARDSFEAGYQTGWLYAIHQNVISQRSFSQAGFSRVATLSALRVGRRFFPMGGDAGLSRLALEE